MTTEDGVSVSVNVNRRSVATRKGILSNLSFIDCGLLYLSAKLRMQT